jgi:hypothetical protein
MAWEEYDRWLQGEEKGEFYQNMLTDAAERPERDRQRKKILKANELPWENSPHGLLKHLVNEEMNTRCETVDAYYADHPSGQPLGQAPPARRAGVLRARG